MHIRDMIKDSGASIKLDSFEELSLGDIDIDKDSDMAYIETEFKKTLLDIEYARKEQTQLMKDYNSAMELAELAATKGIDFTMAQAIDGLLGEGNAVFGESSSVKLDSFDNIHSMKHTDYVLDGIFKFIGDVADALYKFIAFVLKSTFKLIGYFFSMIWKLVTLDFGDSSGGSSDAYSPQVKKLTATAMASVSDDEKTDLLLKTTRRLTKEDYTKIIKELQKDDIFLKGTVIGKYEISLERIKAKYAGVLGVSDTELPELPEELSSIQDLLDIFISKNNTKLHELIVSKDFDFSVGKLSKTLMFYVDRIFMLSGFLNDYNVYFEEFVDQSISVLENEPTLTPTEYISRVRPNISKIETFYKGVIDLLCNRSLRKTYDNLDFGEYLTPHRNMSQSAERLEYELYEGNPDLPLVFDRKIYIEGTRTEPARITSVTHYKDLLSEKSEDLSPPEIDLRDIYFRGRGANPKDVDSQVKKVKSKIGKVNKDTKKFYKKLADISDKINDIISIVSNGSADADNLSAFVGFIQASKINKHIIVKDISESMDVLNFCIADLMNVGVAFSSYVNNLSNMRSTGTKRLYGVCDFYYEFYKKGS